MTGEIVITTAEIEAMSAVCPARSLAQAFQFLL